MALQIYRASTGSGKTYTLTLEFFKIVFAAPLEYRNVLAVTFTNKATGEMESRIVKNLYFAGEVIDYDGPCGGYNLQNAWETGIKAGKEMAK